MMNRMSMTSIHLLFASAPTLVLFRGIPEERAKLGTILFYHGFGESKDGYVSVLQRLAETGFLVVGVDGIGHGERRYPDFHEHFPPITPDLIGNVHLEAAFLSTVRATAQEVPLILDALIERGWAYAERIGIAFVWRVCDLCCYDG
jgi:alpha-beta hydrolase superfamily lysophospholipase